MDKKPFYLTCPKCGHHRFVLPIVKTYRCASCNSQVRVRSKGSYLIESVLLAPASLLLYWSVAAVLQSHGLDRDASQGWGIFAAFLITLPVYVALRPYLVGLECIEPADAAQSKQDHGSAG
ncbi:MAG: hypothetical protein KF796_18870 [Ramlibacter sp.]|nr:hypothetical protein [Ramlibacter sp.]